MWWLILSLLLASVSVLLLWLLFSSSFAWLQLLLSLLLLLLLLLFVPDNALFAGVLTTFPCQKFGAFFPEASKNQSVFIYFVLFIFCFWFRFVSFLLFVLLSCRTFVWTGQWDQRDTGEVSGGICCILRRFNWIPRGCLLSWWASFNGEGDDADVDVDLAANALSVFLSNSRSHIVLHTRHICWYWCCPCVCMCIRENFSLVVLPICN